MVDAGWRYVRRRGWLRFSQMLTAAGVVLLYLATYGAFGFYHLLPQRAAAPFLLLIVVETMALAALYDAPALGLVAILGGLLTRLGREAARAQDQARAALARARARAQVAVHLAQRAGDHQAAAAGAQQRPRRYAAAAVPDGAQGRGQQPQVCGK